MRRHAVQVGKITPCHRAQRLWSDALCARRCTNSVAGAQRVQIGGTGRPTTVEFETGLEPDLLRLAGMELELSVLLEGRNVDPRTPDDLSQYFRDEVLRMAEVQYAA